MADEIVLRQPFPGPGLGVRTLGEVTPERVTTLRHADWARLRYDLLEAMSNRIIDEVSGGHDRVGLRERGWGAPSRRWRCVI